jgi:hypothetical protein
LESLCCMSDRVFHCPVLPSIQRFDKSKHLH